MSNFLGTCQVRRGARFSLFLTCPQAQWPCWAIASPSRNLSKASRGREGQFLVFFCNVQSPCILARHCVLFKVTCFWLLMGWGVTTLSDIALKWCMYTAKRFSSSSWHWITAVGRDGTANGFGILDYIHCQEPQQLGNTVNLLQPPLSHTKPVPMSDRWLQRGPWVPVGQSRLWPEEEPLSGTQPAQERWCENVVAS